jgi:hypothetical protein
MLRAGPYCPRQIMFLLSETNHVLFYLRHRSYLFSEQILIFRSIIRSIFSDTYYVVFPNLRDKFCHYSDSMLLFLETNDAYKKLGKAYERKNRLKKVYFLRFKGVIRYFMYRFRIRFSLGTLNDYC